MKTVCAFVLFITMPTVLAASAPATQDEAALRKLEGTRVTVLMDMPATKEGINYYPERREKIDYRQYSDRIKEFGIAIEADTEATITEIKIKGKHIEFQLDGAGYGTFGDFQPSRPNVPYPRKTRREEDLERDLRDEDDPEAKRRIQRDLDYYRDQRERDYQRNRRQAAEQYDRDVERVAAARLRAGSRINVRFDRNVPAQTKTTGGLQATLSAMIRFDTDVESTVQYESSETTAPTPDSTVGDVSGWNAPVRKGMSQFDVERRLGQAVGCTDNTPHPDERRVPLRPRRRNRRDHLRQQLAGRLRHRITLAGVVRVGRLPRQPATASPAAASWLRWACSHPRMFVLRRVPQR